MELSTNLKKILARAGYQQPNHKISMYTKMIGGTLLVIDFIDDKKKIRLTQWFLANQKHLPPLIWDSSEKDISFVKNINDIAILESTTIKNGCDLWKGQSIEKLIPQLSFARNLEFKL